MAIVLPPWLHTPDIAEQYSKGLQIGASIGEEQNRLQAENARTIMESQARADANKRSMLENQARIQTEAAYRTSEIGLRQQALKQQADVVAAHTRDAALKLADQQGFAADLAGGMKVEDALYRHPRLATPAAVTSAHKDALDLGSQRLDLARSSLDERQREFDQRQAKTKAPKVNMVPVPLKDESGAVTGKMMLPESDPRAQSVLREGGQPTPPEVLDPGYWDKVGRLRNTGSVGEDGVPAEDAAETQPDTKPEKLTKGTVYKGHRFLGGNPADKKNWEKVQ